MKPGHGDKLSRKAEAAIAALLNQGTLVTAAATAGVSVRTLKRWLREPTFAAAYREARGEALVHAVGLMQGVAVEAVDRLRANLTCGNPSVEVSASRALLDLVLRAGELLDLTDRIYALERAAASRDQGDELRQ